MRIEQENSPAPAGHYVERINRAVDHIVRHLERRLNLDTVAEVACFSPFHSHRIFRTIVMLERVNPDDLGLHKHAAQRRR